MEEKLTYEEALAKLEELVGKIEDPEADLSAIGGQVKKAMELVRYCKACIAGTKEELDKML